MTDKGFNQSELAKATGVKQSAISAYIAGTSTPSADALYRMAKALGLSMDELYADDATKKEPSHYKNKTDELEKKIRHLKKVCETLGKQVSSLGHTVDEFSQIISQ